MTKKLNLERTEGLKPIVDDLAQMNATVEALTSNLDTNGPTGYSVIVPKNVSSQRAIDMLQESLEAERTKAVINHMFENIHYYPAAWLLEKVLREKYGVDFASPTPGMFGDSPPQQFTFPLNAHDIATVTVGRFKVGEMVVTTSFEGHEQGLSFCIHIETKNSNAAAAHRLISLIEAEADPWIGQTIIFDGSSEPRKVTIVEPTIGRDQIALNPPEYAGLNMFLNQIDHIELLVSKGIPFKRGVLLHGPWGTGKTLAAAAFMQACHKAGITVFHEKQISADCLVKTMRLAQRMATRGGAFMVFCEDIDLVPSRSLINMMDGADNKASNVSIVATTNHCDHLDPALTRTGRFDIVMEFMLPEEDVRRDILAINKCEAWSETISKATEGFTGSDLAEVARRAQIQSLINGQECPTVEDVLGSAVTIARPPKQKKKTNHADELVKQIFQGANPLGVLLDTVTNIEGMIEDQ